MAFRKLTVASLAVLTGVQAHADIKETFAVYKEKHNKVYADDAEEATRLKNFHVARLDYSNCRFHFQSDFDSSA